MKISKAAAACVLSLLSCIVSIDAQSCTPPTGLESLPEGVRDDITQALASGQLSYLWLPQAFPFIGELVKDETPIQFRNGQIQGSTVYHSAAKYHPTALDIWGKDTHRICQDGDEDYFKLHEKIALAYTFYYSGINVVPSSEGVIKPILESFGLPAAFLDVNSPDPSTPWGLAKIVVDEMAVSVKNDGWNADGMLSNEYNALPYSDFTMMGDNGAVLYEKYDVKDKKNGNSWPWQPLVESDGRGYFTKQEHVTPFIGFTGRLYGMDKEFFESFNAPSPRYDYTKEAAYVLDQTKTMATSDLQKMLLEFYDSKFTSILPLQINWSIASGADEFTFWYNDMVLVNTMYDATLLVWKEKVVHNAVRPTTVVHAIRGDEMVDTYAGPFKGTKEMKAKDWQPFVRTMPHAEYPSGSACICVAYAETLQQLTGKDDIDVTLSQTFEAGSSKTEKGMTPSEELTVSYNKWSDIAKDCGESRLYGGMHFEKSVTSGNELCSGFVKPVVDKAMLLLVGDPNGALTAQGDDNIRVTPKKRKGNMFLR